jgi:homoserine dehydrogenase
VVVELIGGLEPARALIATALGRGCDVVTANKALLASDTELIRLAAVKGRTIRCSAAVGGGTPALESVRVARETSTISAISGVINGTTNFILDELADGASFSSAVKRAQDLGYAEADPTLDLNGTDAAQKLILLAREAFDVDIPLTASRRKGIDEQTTSQTGLVRLVAECRRVKTGFETTVTPVHLEPTHPLAQVKGVSNRLLIETTDGQVHVITGRGAGRWPTTEAVLADLIELVAEVNSGVAVEEEECVA